MARERCVGARGERLNKCKKRFATFAEVSFVDGLKARHTPLCRPGCPPIASWTPMCHDVSIHWQACLLHIHSKSFENMSFGCLKSKISSGGGLAPPHPPGASRQ